MDKRYQIFGATPSPYTQKMISLMRFKRIPFDVHFGDVASLLKERNITPPKPILLPVMLLEDDSGNEVATTDSTPIIRTLEKKHPERSVLPQDQALNFINYLLEDFGDEWLTKYMFHYRWHFESDTDKAGTILPLVNSQVNLPKDILQEAKQFISQRQIERLWVVGSNENTAKIIDSSFKKFMTLFNLHLENSSYLLGNLPTSSDFSFYGQLSQLIGFEATSRTIAHDLAIRVVAWHDLMNDLSGLDVNKDSLNVLEDCPDSLKQILNQVGKFYIPVLLANSKAIEDGNESLEAEVDGSVWKQKSFRYQAKCLTWIIDEFNTLNDLDKKRVLNFLDGTGCEKLFNR